MEGSGPPPAAGVRLPWADVPGRVRGAVEARLGERVTAATSSPGGFSPGVAARLRTSGGRRVFVKAVGPKPNPDSPAIHRREAEVVEGEGGWILLAFEDVAGRSPAESWRPDELDRALDALASLSDLLTPSPLPPASVGSAGGWSVVNGRH